MGYLRLILAITVALVHVYGRQFAWSGQTAVFGFYTISGFLMTLVVSGYYSQQRFGRLKFLLNRAVRIYPTYWCCLLIFIAILSLSHINGNYAPWKLVEFPKTFEQWVPQISIWGMMNIEGGKYPVRFIRHMWSINVELLYYVIIGLAAGYSRRLAVVWLIASLVLMVWIRSKTSHYVPFYNTYWGCSHAFALGSIAYYYRDHFMRFCTTNMVIAITLALAILIAPSVIVLPRGSVFTLTDYMLFAPLPFAYVILCLYKHNKHKGVSRVEQLCADLTYPMFLIHMAVAIGVMIVFPDIKYMTARLWWTALPVTFMLSYILVIFVERPLTDLRHQMRKQ